MIFSAGWSVPHDPLKRPTGSGHFLFHLRRFTAERWRGQM